MSDRSAERQIDELISGKSGLVYSIARSFLWGGLPWEDLVAEGNRGLLDAAESFQPSRNVEFSTYCYNFVRRYIQDAVDHYGRSVRIPRKTLNVICRISAVRRKLEESDGVVPDAAAVAEASGLQLHIVEKYLPLVHLNECRLNLSVAENVSGDEEAAEEGVADVGIVPPDEEIIRAEQRARLSAVLARLTPRQQTVINRRFGLDGRQNATLRDLAEEMHCSIEAVRKIQNQALKKLKNLYEREEQI